MLILLPILVLLLSALGLTLLARFRPKFQYNWLVAAGGALLAWLLAWGLRLRLPSTISLPLWREQPLLLTAPGLLADGVSWSFAMALATLCLALVLTDVGRAAETSWMVWAGDLGISALGLLAVLAGNPVTLILFWVLVDVLEATLLMRQVEDAPTRQRVMLFFSTNMLGLMAVVWAMAAAMRGGLPLSFDTINPQTEVFLLVAAGLRMGILPLQVAFLQDVHQKRGQGTLLRLVPPATSLVLLVRTAYSGVPLVWKGVLLAFAALAGLYGAVAWARAKDEMEGRIYWIVALAGMSFAAALQSRPAASLAWGLGMLYAGSPLFLSTIKERRMLPIGVLAVFTLSGLPFSPTYVGLGMHTPFNFFSVFLIGAQVYLVYGYLEFMLRESEPLVGVERWVKLIYPLGLALPPATYLLASGWLAPDLGTDAPTPVWPLIAAIVLAGGGYFSRGKVQAPRRVLDAAERFFSLGWLYTFLGGVYNALGRAVGFVTLLLEGEGGVLWALVLVALLISLLTQQSGGG